MYFWYYLQFFNLTLKFHKQNLKIYFFSTRNLYILGENTSKYCSQISVVHVHAFFSKVYPACHNMVNGIRPGSNSK